MRDLPTHTLAVRPVVPPRGGMSELFDYTLFVGPAACFHHSLDVMTRLDRVSALCLDDAQIALGQTQRRIDQPVDELMAEVQPPIASLRILTSCVSAFLGADFRAVARGIAQRHGIVCVHEQNNRMTVAGRCDKGLVSHTGDAAGFAAGLLDCADVLAGGAAGGAGAGAADGGAGTDGEDARPVLVFLSEALHLDPRNELHEVAQQAGCARVQTLREWSEPAGLARARRARLIVVADAQCEELAGQASRRWNVPCVHLPLVYDLEEIDAAYRALGEALGTPFDVADARARAQESVERARRAVGARALRLDLAGASRPWRLAKALLDAGFDVERIGCSRADRARPVAHDADYEALLAAWPQVAGRIAEEEFIHNKSKLVDVAAGTARETGTAGAAGAADAAGAAQPAEGECFGYFALECCMNAVEREAMRR